MKVISGKVTAIANGTVLLESGETFRLTDTTLIVLSNGARGKWQDLRQGVNVRIMLNAVSRVVYSVEVVAAR